MALLTPTKYWKSSVTSSTWATAANWSTSSHTGTDTGGVPTASDIVQIPPGVTVGFGTTAATCSVLQATGASTFTGTSATLTIASGITLPSGTVWSHTGTIAFSGTAATTNFDINGVTLACAVTLTGSGTNTFKLASNFAIASGKTFTLTNGTLDLNNYNLNCGLFVSTGTATRGILFATSSVINLTSSSAATVINLAATGFTTTGYPKFVIGGGGAVTKTVTLTGFTASNAVSVYGIDSVASIYTITGTVYDVNLSGAGSAVLANSVKTICGNLILQSTHGTWSGTSSNVTTFADGISATTRTISLGNSTAGALTFTGNSTYNVSGNFTLASALIFNLGTGIVNVSGNISGTTFTVATTNTGTVNMNGAGGSFTALAIGNGTLNFNNTGGTSYSWTTFSSTGGTVTFNGYSSFSSSFTSTNATSAGIININAYVSFVGSATLAGTLNLNVGQNGQVGIFSANALTINSTGVINLYTGCSISTTTTSTTTNVTLNSGGIINMAGGTFESSTTFGHNGTINFTNVNSTLTVGTALTLSGTSITNLLHADTRIVCTTISFSSGCTIGTPSVGVRTFSTYATFNSFPALQNYNSINDFPLTGITNKRYVVAAVETGYNSALIYKWAAGQYTLVIENEVFVDLSNNNRYYISTAAGLQYYTANDAETSYYQFQVNGRSTTNPMPATLVVNGSGNWGIEFTWTGTTSLGPTDTTGKVNYKFSGSSPVGLASLTTRSLDLGSFSGIPFVASAGSIYVYGDYIDSSSLTNFFTTATSNIPSVITLYLRGGTNAARKNFTGGSTGSVFNIIFDTGSYYYSTGTSTVTTGRLTVNGDLVLGSGTGSDFSVGSLYSVAGSTIWHDDRDTIYVTNEGGAADTAVVSIAGTTKNISSQNTDSGTIRLVAVGANSTYSRTVTNYYTPSSILDAFNIFVDRASPNNSQDYIKYTGYYNILDVTYHNGHTILIGAYSAQFIGPTDYGLNNDVLGSVTSNTLTVTSKINSSGTLAIGALVNAYLAQQQRYTISNYNSTTGAVSVVPAENTLVTGTLTATFPRQLVSITSTPSTISVGTNITLYGDPDQIVYQIVALVDTSNGGGTGGNGKYQILNNEGGGAQNIITVVGSTLVDFSTIIDVSSLTGTALTINSKFILSSQPSVLYYVSELIPTASGGGTGGVGKYYINQSSTSSDLVVGSVSSGVLTFTKIYGNYGTIISSLSNTPGQTNPIGRVITLLTLSGTGTITSFGTGTGYAGTYTLNGTLNRASNGIVNIVTTTNPSFNIYYGYTKPGLHEAGSATIKVYGAGGFYDYACNNSNVTIYDTVKYGYAGGKPMSLTITSNATLSSYLSSYGDINVGNSFICNGTVDTTYGTFNVIFYSNSSCTFSGGPLGSTTNVYGTVSATGGSLVLSNYININKLIINNTPTITLNDNAIIKTIVQLSNNVCNIVLNNTKEITLTVDDIISKYSVLPGSSGGTTLTSNELIITPAVDSGIQPILKTNKNYYVGNTSSITPASANIIVGNYSVDTYNIRKLTISPLGSTTISYLFTGNLSSAFFAFF